MYSVDLSFLGEQTSIIHKRDQGEFELRVYSNNVRVDTDKRFPHENPWSQRKDGVLAALKSRDETYPTLVGLQELKYNQLTDILQGLNGNDQYYPWTYFGVGRDDGKQAGEYAAILYNTQEWSLLNGTSKWLSETPDTPSIAWNADTIRIVTITTMQHKQSGKIVNYLNTHFDQQSEEARQNSANLIDGWVQQIPNNFLTFLSGDFNSVSSDVAYQTIKTHMADSSVIADNKYNADLKTYSGFEPGDNQNNIDFIWTPLNTNQDNSPVRAIGYEVIDNMYNGSKFSDHRPITTHFKIRQ